MRISDLIRKGPPRKTEPPPPAPPKEEKSPPPKPLPIARILQRNAERLAAGRRLRAAAPPRFPAEQPVEPALPAREKAAAEPPQKKTTLGAAYESSSSQAREVYGRLVESARAFFLGFAAEPVRLPDLEEICEGIDRAIECLEAREAPLLELTERSTPDDYLPGHVANVAILSIAASRHLGWSTEVQRSVGMGSLFHDAGMVFHRPKQVDLQHLTAEERQALRRFPEDGFKIMKRFLDALAPEPRTVVENIILQSQERISGNGYPARLKGSQISIEAQAVGLCDAYESISHPRPYRKRRLSHETLRYLIELSGETFDGNLIKALWETLSLFPPGSFLKLSSGEIAKVVDLNPQMPTRPVVQLIADASGGRARQATLIDLAQTPGVSIQKAVDECALDLADKRLALELRAQKWWVR